MTASPQPDSPLPSVEQLSEQYLDSLADGDQWMWELAWKLNEEFPAVELAEKVALARQVVIGLTIKGSTELWRGQWPAGPVAPVSREEMAKIMAEDAPWHDPEHAEILVVVEVAHLN
ncbi:MAG: hypothetical protein M3N98_09960 [Actinomycetota bacterium]|nr:hypothetical protein [Actinomycetota bacterium]